MTDRIVGIDLGTSNTVVAIVDEMERIRVLADAEGHTVHPSVVSFHPNGGVVVGVGGKQRKVLDPQNTIYSAKRMIGQPFRSFAVTETARRVPFQIKEGPNEQAMVVTRAGEFAIPEISAIVLDHVGKIAAKAIQGEVSRAVVTVPASFTDVQRASTATAGALAGLTVVRVLNEPTAAALAYGSTKRLNEIIAVYDFGGGTFDITILKLEDQVYTVLGTSGDAFLGGEDIDERIVERMVSTFLKAHRIDLRTDDVSMMRLRAVAEHTKIELSRRSRAVLKIEEVAYAPNGSPLDLTMEITRDELVASIGDLVERTFVSCKEAMALAGVAPNLIADVILVGGTTRIPLVRDHVARFFGMQPRTDVNPDDAIATGAALQASSIEQMLARAPQRAPASIPIPVDDLIGDVLAEPVQVEPEPARSPIAEVKRPKRGTDMFSGKPSEPAAKRPKEEPAKTAARAEAFFGDLFGDKAAKPGETPPAKAVNASAPARSRPARRSRDLDWEPPAGSAFSDDSDAVDVFAPEPANPADPRLADLSDDVESLAEQHVEMIDFSDLAVEQPELVTGFASQRMRPKLANVDDIAIEVAEPSMPAIRLDEIDDVVEIVPQGARVRADEIVVEISMPAIRLDDIDDAPRVATRGAAAARPRADAVVVEVSAPAIRLDELDLQDEPSIPGPPELDWAPPAGVELAREIVVPTRAAPRISIPIELAAPSTPPSRRAQARGAVDDMAPVRDDDFADDARRPEAPRRAPPELDFDPAPYSPPPVRAPTEWPDPHHRPLEPTPTQPSSRAPTTNMRGPTVIDVTPRGLGIGTVAGFCEELIRRNSQLPATIRKSFVTSRDAQETVRIVICQGESRRLESNLVIGDLVLPNLPRRARGETRIEVEFVLDASCILHVSARDSATGVEQRAKLDLKGGMAPEDLQAAARRLQNLANI